MKKKNEAIKAKDTVINENKELKAQFEKAETDKKIIEFESYLNEQIKEGKATPAQKEDLIALAMGNDELTNFEYNDKNIKGDRIELVKRVIDNSSAVEMGEHSKKGDLPGKPSSKEDEIEEKIMAYAKENKCSISEAIDNMEV
jgi:hypothetical protein